MTPVGKNRLNGLLKEMCVAAGLPDTYSNHSLRAYGATAMFQAGVPEKLIQQRTGHRSIETLRKYERTSESRLLDVSNVVLNSGSTDDNTTSAPSDVVELQENKNAQNSKSVSTCSVMPVMPSSSKVTPGPTIIISGCTFNNCSMSLNGRDTNPPYIGDLLSGLTAEDIFND